MSETTARWDEHDPDQEELGFRTASFVQNDLLLSLIYFGLILFLPLILWNHVDDYVIFLWQVGMFTISAIRWLCRYTITSGKKDRTTDDFWNGVLIFLTLMDGLGWGIGGALLFPADSILSMSLVALLLIGIGGVGAVSYSARMLIAIPYLLCTVLPYITRLYATGGNEEFLLASMLGLLTIMFSFAADRLSLTLGTALQIDEQDEETIFALESQNEHLSNMVERKRNHVAHLENELTNITHELEKVHGVVTKHEKDLSLVCGRMINHLNDLETLKQTSLNDDQSKVLVRMEKNVRFLLERLGEDEIEEENTPQAVSGHEPAYDKDEASNSPVVLIVEPDSHEREKIEACLQELNLDYTSVEDVPAALSALCQAEDHFGYELIIASLYMPEMDGIGFAECLKDDQEFQSIRTILTYSDKLPSKNRLIKAGVDWVVQKETLKEDLPQAIESLVNGERLSQLPASIESLVEDTIQISLPPDEQEPITAPSSVDKSVLEGLRSSTTLNFIEIVNDFLEDAPRLISEARETLSKNDLPGLQRSIRELGNRSLHIGANDLADLAMSVESAITENGIDRVPGMLQMIEAEFIQVESVLLGELTNGALVSDPFKH